MHKQMISVTIPQIQYLRKEADELGISIADVIRRIIDEQRRQTNR